VQQRLPAKRVPPIGFAHRGARAHTRENTIEAFELALRLGASGLESDVWLTADGVAVLDHDGLVRRGMRARPISTFRRADLPAHIPSLADLYTVCGTGFELSLDLKDAAVAREIVNVTRAADPSMLARLWLCHHDWTYVASLRELDSDVRLVDSTRLSRIREGPERRAANLAEHNVDAINLHYSDWTGGLTTLFHRFDRFCLGWDLQHERLLREGIRMGLDGVFSDWVDRMTVAIENETS
jgi:glycerophosphoryl diester phosphodiesterase